MVTTSDGGKLGDGVQGKTTAQSPHHLPQQVHHEGIQESIRPYKNY